jgi:hypothetical protein
MTNEKQNGLVVEKPVAFKKGPVTVPGSVTGNQQKEKSAIEAESEEKEEDNDKKISSLETDPETLLATDPQENMRGPISSVMQDIRENGEVNDAESKEEADKKKDDNT